jgi:glycosyltransferase involved in cell wall biosynthesis
MITYNHEHYIAQAVESVMMQKTTFSVELVVGEDCSADGTRDILLDLQSRHPERIRLLLREQNLGSMRNFVQTLECCGGEYVALLDGDDYWTDPFKLQKQVELLDGDPKCVLCFHAVSVLFERNGQSQLLPAANECAVPDRLRLDDIISGNRMASLSVVFRRRWIPVFPGWFYGLKLGDWPLYMMLGTHGYFRCIRDSMGVYRDHGNGAWSTKSIEKRTLAELGMLEKMRHYLGPTYTRALCASLSRRHARLADLYERNLNIPHARHHSLKAILLSLRAWRWPRRYRIGMFLRMFAHPVYRVARMVMKVVQSSRFIWR